MTLSSPDSLPVGPASDSTWSNPAKIGRKVRELAHRSHVLLGAGCRSHVPASLTDDGQREDAAELLQQVARLQRTIHARRLGVLTTWIDALRRQLEERVNRSEKESAR
jgi:hypothetical protein